MADRWNPKNAIDRRYVWLPVEFDNDRLVLRWYDKWELGRFVERKNAVNSLF